VYWIRLASDVSNVDALTTLSKGDENEEEEEEDLAKDCIKDGDLLSTLGIKVCESINVSTKSRVKVTRIRGMPTGSLAL
jgi:hypothetical protein